MKWLACLVGLASCTSATSPSLPTDFELQIDYRLDPNVSGDYNGFTYAGGETIEVDLVYPDFATAADDHSHTLTFSMGSNVLTEIAGPSCDETLGYGPPYHEVDEYQVIWNAGSATPDLSGQGTCYAGSGMIGWIN